MVNPSGLTAQQIGPGEVRLSWQPVDQAYAYAVTGSGMPTGPSPVTVLAESGTTFAVAHLPLGPGRWTVGSVYLSGIQIRATPSTEFTPVTLNVAAWPVTAATAVNPSGFKAVETAPGTIQLSWERVSGVSYYALFGPGVTAGGQKVAGANTFTATNVPPGNQQWTLGSYYEPGPVSTAASSFPRVTLAVTGPPPPPPPPATTGRYLISVVALRAYQASVDDELSRDGRGDEVYAAAYVRRYDRKTGAIVEFPVRKTMPYGDVTHFGAQRIQAGTSSGTGGIRDGDIIPPRPLSTVRNTPAQDTTFPWKLWEGVLGDGADVLLISPSLWEQDGSDALYPLWEQQQQALNASLFSYQSIQDQITEKKFGTVVSSASGIGGGGMLGTQLRQGADLALLSVGLPLVNLLAVSNDRPIGLLANGIDQAMLPNQVVVLTREIVEAALSSPALGAIPSPVPDGAALPFRGVGVLRSMLAPQSSGLERIGMIAPLPGILVVAFEDRNMPSVHIVNERPAMYQMFIQVERLP